MQSERILQLLAKKMGQAASEEELQELQDLIRRNPDQHLLLELLQSIEGEKLHQEPAMSEKKLVDESWSKLQLELNSAPAPVHTMKRRNWLRYAAAIGGILLLGATAFYFAYEGNQKQITPTVAKINRVAVPYGMPEKRLLPDSTEVWLNAGSTIRYKEDFIQQQREVYLEGEAFFSVKHDPEHPFIVHAGNIAVRALGTQFNVHAYGDENKIEATLISGKVQVTMSDKPDQRIILEPNEKLTVTKATDNPVKKGETGTELSFQVQEVMPMTASAAVTEVAWMQDKLAFRDEPFRELAKRMERRYNTRIVFNDSLLQKERLSGVFENENIRKALGLLQMTTPFRYRFLGDSVVLSR